MMSDAGKVQVKQELSPTSSNHSGSPQARSSNYPYSYLGNNSPGNHPNSPGSQPPQFNYPNCGGNMPYWNPDYQQQMAQFNYYQQQFQGPNCPPFNYNPNMGNPNRFFNPHFQPQGPGNNPRYQNNRNNNHRNNQYNQNNNRYQNNNRNFNNNNNNNNQNPNQHQNQNHGPNQRPNQGQGGKNKAKIDKRDLPENNKYYCEVCDRGFKTEEKYKEHCDGHETCGVNGCKFTAAAKLVEIHYNNFHASGLDKKCSTMQTPEEIQKYRDERKKNFPSVQNAEKKTILDEEKAKRGAVLDTKQFSRLNRRNKNRKHDQNDKDGNKSDEDADGSPSNDVESPNRYGRNKDNDPQFKKNKNKKNRHHKSRAQQNARKPTLLQKLLADEIRHERNIILQCVKYVVKNNFFDSTPTPQPDVAKESSPKPVEVPAPPVNTDQPSSSDIPME